MICTYMLNFLLICRTCIHVYTYMFLCNYDVFLSIESLCWIGLVGYQIRVTTVKLKISV